MVLAFQMVPSVIVPCSSCTSTYNNITANHVLNQFPKNKSKSEWTNEDWSRYTVPYNIDKAVSTKNTSNARKPVTYQTVPRSNKFNKNSAKSLRRRGSLFQPGRTNCNQRTIR